MNNKDINKFTHTEEQCFCKSIETLNSSVWNKTKALCINIWLESPTLIVGVLS